MLTGASCAKPGINMTKGETHVFTRDGDQLVRGTNTIATLTQGLWLRRDKADEILERRFRE
jgi:hypothetical protein